MKHEWVHLNQNTFLFIIVILSLKQQFSRALTFPLSAILGKTFAMTFTSFYPAGSLSGLGRSEGGAGTLPHRNLEYLRAPEMELEDYRKSREWRYYPKVPHVALWLLFYQVQLTFCKATVHSQPGPFISVWFVSHTLAWFSVEWEYYRIINEQILIGWWTTLKQNGNHGVTSCVALLSVYWAQDSSHWRSHVPSILIALNPLTWALFSYHLTHYPWSVCNHGTTARSFGGWSTGKLCINRCYN